MSRILAVVMVAALARNVRPEQVPPHIVAPARMPKIGTVDARFLSYNIEMVEVTGGRFWKPYSANDEPRADTKSASVTNFQVGIDPNLFQYRAPIDLANSRLRSLAKGIGPAYVRVSGSWANSTYFQDDDDLPLKQPPGFNGVLTRRQWKGVMDFGRAVGAQIVTSFAISPGTRNPESVWTSRQATQLLDYTKVLGGRIAAAEFMNEPTFATMQGAPVGYDAAAFARDIRVFSSFLREQSPSTLFLGPGGVGEGRPLALAARMIASEDMLKATGPMFDAFSYHFYGTTSLRCGRGIAIDQALSPEWLDRTGQVEAFYAGLRDAYLPGKSIWLTETAEAACGGDQLAGQFADTFRFVNQLGALARKGVQVVMHNTLAASDYGLIDQATLEPRPNYWAAVLWNRTMGTIVLDPGRQHDVALSIYAHCMKQNPGGVTLVALNLDKQDHTLEGLVPGERFTLTAFALTSTTVLLNSRELKAKADGELPPIQGQPFKAGSFRLPAHSITFLTMPSAGNSSCQ